MTSNEVNISKLIEETYIVPESVFDKKRTKTSHFMMNSIFNNNTLFSTSYFVNAFLGDGHYESDVERSIYVLFKCNLKDNKWNVLYTRLIAKPEFVMQYVCGESPDGDILLMMVFQVPDLYANDYYNFLVGRYSQFSEVYKNRFPRYTYNTQAQPAESTIWRVVNKSPELKKELESFFTVRASHPYVFDEEDELWGIPELKYEIYRYDDKK